jgi:gliding motility-associated-like protein
MQFTVVDFKTSGTLIKSTGYNGKTVIDMLAAGSTIAGKGLDSINLTVKVLANGYEGVIANIADGSAISKWGPVKRQSIDISRSGGRLHGAGVPTNNLAPKINLIIADVLTPNNDGINDKWIILRPFSSKIDVTIFNRWGQIVYKKADYQNEWDGIGTGNFLGRLLPHGTYFYLIDITEKSTGAKEVKKGYLTLKRDY